MASSGKNKRGKHRGGNKRIRETIDRGVMMRVMNPIDGRKRRRQRDFAKFDFDRRLPGRADRYAAYKLARTVSPVTSTS